MSNRPEAIEYESPLLRYNSRVSRWLDSRSFPVAYGVTLAGVVGTIIGLSAPVMVVLGVTGVGDTPLGSEVFTTTVVVAFVAAQYWVAQGIRLGVKTFRRILLPSEEAAHS